MTTKPSSDSLACDPQTSRPALFDRLFNSLRRLRFRRQVPIDSPPPAPVAVAWTDDWHSEPVDSGLPWITRAGIAHCTSGPIQGYVPMVAINPTASRLEAQNCAELMRAAVANLKPAAAWYSASDLQAMENQSIAAHLAALDPQSDPPLPDEVRRLVVWARSANVDHA